MQTVLICASVHPRPVSALWSHPVLSPSYQRVPLFYMELVFSLYSLSLSLPRSLCHSVMPDSRIKKLRSRVTEKSHIPQYFQNSLFSVVSPSGSVEFLPFCRAMASGEAAFFITSVTSSLRLCQKFCEKKSTRFNFFVRL